MTARTVLIVLAMAGALSTAGPLASWAQGRGHDWRDGRDGRGGRGEHGRSYGYGPPGRPFGGPDGGGVRDGFMGFVPPGLAGPPGPPDGYPGGWREQQEEARRAVREGRHVPLARILPHIRARTPGRMLDAGMEPGPNGRPVYRLRWAAQDGRRIDYLVDPETGAIIGVEGGR